jgi:hypothetical protein
MKAALAGHGRLRWVIIALALVIAAIAAFAVPGTTSAFVAKVTNSKDTASTASLFSCTAAAAQDSSTAVFQYSLTEASGSTVAVDSSGKGNNGTYQGSMVSSTATPIACPRDRGGAYVLDGSTSYISTSTQGTAPSTYSEEVWFKTTVAGGRLIGWGTQQTGSSGQEDRSVYVSTTGQLVFATYSNGNQSLTTPKTYTDGAWHHVVATQSPTTGMMLYVDGAIVMSNATYTGAEPSTGYWRIGYDNLGGWPNSGTNYYVTGSMRFAAVYSSVLSAQQVSDHYSIGK